MTYSSSRQCKYWTFSYEQLQEERNIANTKAIEDYLQRNNMKEDVVTADNLFSVGEEWICVRAYLRVLKSLAVNFRPQLPNYVLITAFMFVKRFYIHNSVMDFHPKEIMLVCLYMACKNEEFHVSIGQFLQNLPRNKEKYSDIIIRSELFVIQRLKYDLAVYNSLSPAHGLLLMICHNLQSTHPIGQEGFKENFHVLYPQLINLLMDLYLTDVPLLSSPPQMALCGLYYLYEDLDKSKIKSDQDKPDESEWLSLLENFISQKLCDNDSAHFNNLWKKVKWLVDIARSQNNRENIPMQQLENKLVECRNPLYDVDSEVYKSRMGSSPEFNIGSPF